MKKPTVFRCYRCNELRNGKPVSSFELNGVKRELCQQCQEEAQGKVA